MQAVTIISAIPILRLICVSRFTSSVIDDVSAEPFMCGLRLVVNFLLIRWYSLTTVEHVAIVSEEGLVRALRIRSRDFCRKVKSHSIRRDIRTGLVRSCRGEVEQTNTLIENIKKM